MKRVNSVLSYIANQVDCQFYDVIIILSHQQFALVRILFVVAIVVIDYLIC